MAVMQAYHSCVNITYFLTTIGLPPPPKFHSTSTPKNPIPNDRPVRRTGCPTSPLAGDLTISSCLRQSSAEPERSETRTPKRTRKDLVSPASPGHHTKKSRQEKDLSIATSSKATSSASLFPMSEARTYKYLSAAISIENLFEIIPITLSPKSTHSPGYAVICHGYEVVF